MYNYARDGRGESGDTLPYAVDREIEDIEALIAEAGGLAHVYRVSSGGALALEAAAAGTAIDRLAVYEVPYGLVDGASARTTVLRRVNSGDDPRRPRRRAESRSDTCL